MRRRILDNVWARPSALEQEVALATGHEPHTRARGPDPAANEGLVEVIPRHGMRVLPVSPTDMREIYEILTALGVHGRRTAGARKPSER
jgi:hypothetical protein